VTRGIFKLIAFELIEDDVILKDLQLME